jgi:hypothetical protein
MSAGQKYTLFSAFSRIPDPRHRQGRRHPLQAILAQTTAAILCGCKGVDAIAQWGRVNLRPNLALFRKFGFTSFKSPAPSTFHEVFKAIDIAAVEEVLADWAEGLLPGSRARILSMDGKTLCGSQSGPEAPGVHLLSAFAREPGCTLAQVRVDEKTNEAKAALELLAQLILENAVITGDAMFCQREICSTVVARGGDYLMVVKENQPSLKAAIKEAFETPVPPLGTATLAG